MKTFNNFTKLHPWKICIISYIIFILFGLIFCWSLSPEIDFIKSFKVTVIFCILPSLFIMFLMHTANKSEIFYEKCHELEKKLDNVKTVEELHILSKELENIKKLSLGGSHNNEIIKLITIIITINKYLK